MNINKLIEDIQGTLDCEKRAFKKGGSTDENIQGWIEGLEYVLGQICINCDHDDIEEIGRLNYDSTLEVRYKCTDCNAEGTWYKCSPSVIEWEEI